MTDFILENPTTSSTSVVLPDGNILVAWFGEVNSESRIWAQTFTSDGTPVSSAFAVSDVAPYVEVPRLALLADGNVAFNWYQSESPAYTETKARIFTTDGDPVTAIISVNTTTAGEQNYSSIAALDNGGFVITFDSNQGTGSPDDGSGTGIRARIFDSAGVPTTPADFVVNVSTQGNQNANHLTAIEGGFVLVYQSPDGDASTGIRAQIFDNDGNAVGDEIVVSEDAVSDFHPRVMTTADGGFLIAWEAQDQDTGVNAVRAMAYDSEGTALWSSPSVVTEGPYDEISTIIELPDGGYVAVYLKYAEDWSGSDVYAQLLDADGQATGDPIPLADAENEYLGTPTAELLDDGELLVTWVNASQVTSVKTFDLSGSEEPVENDPPTNLAISNDTILESYRKGSTIGVLSATDPDGDDITWSLVSGQGDNSYFQLKTDDEGNVKVVLANPLDHEASGGVYDLVVRATDSEGNATDRTIAITVEDDPFKLSTVPTGKTYTSIVENAPEGTDIGYIQQFDTSFVPVSATLVDDADGAFAIEQRTVGGQTRYYIVTDKALDFEDLAELQVTVEATDANGVTKQKTFDVQVLDATETGDVARGRITIDAATALAVQNGGMNWDTFMERAFETTGNSFPSFVGGGGWSAEDPASEYVFTDRADGRILSLEGSDLVYNWSDPATGEDVHVISGKIDNITFGSEGELNGEGTWDFTKTELTISGLDLSNDASLMARIDGEVNILTSAFMYGADNGSSSWLEFVKATLSSYAQDFLGSKATDRYTGTVFDDTAKGGKGKDVLNGNAGDDILTGGKGADKLTGGDGADTFVFLKGDTGNKRNQADTIFDFSTADGDIIDLTGWDANSKKAGDQDFRFIGSEKFHGKAGELHFVKEKSDTWIEGDTNGDRKADFIIHLDDAMKLKIDHFEF